MKQETIIAVKNTPQPVQHKNKTSFILINFL
jgi:hypothetical protein